MDFILFLLAGFLSGILQGMGMGAGTILIPVLTIFLSVPQQSAQGINMIAFLPGAALALIIHKKEGRLEAKNRMPLLLIATAGAIAGALIATFIDAEWLRKLFGAFLIILAPIQWKRKA